MFSWIGGDVGEIRSRCISFFLLWVSDVMSYRDVPPLIPLLATGYLMLIYGLLGLLQRRKA